jgi:predicted amidohydrolase
MEDVMSFKAAAIQMRSGVDPARNAADMERLVRAAAAEGAVYVQTPEMTGAIQKDRQALRAQLRDDDGDIIVATAARLARELGIHVHVGSTAIARPDGKIANRGFLFAPDGSRICSYDKIHMFDVDLDNGESWRESAAYQPGEVARIAELPLGKFGFAICYDVRFPQLFRAEALAGAEVLTVPAAFTRQTGEAHWEILLRARAIENGAFVIAAWGKILAIAGGAGEEIIFADIDPSLVAAARGKIPNLRNAREFGLDTVIPLKPAGGEAA